MSPRKNKKSASESKKPRAKNKAKGGRLPTPVVGAGRTREQLMSPDARRMADEAIKDGEARIKRIEAMEKGLDPDTVAPDPNLKHQTQQRGRKGKHGKGEDGKNDAASSSQTPKPARPSLLNAAAIILAETAAPMRVKDILARIEARGLWVSPKGKTPGATLNASIIREIAAKGDKSRFRKADRGLFAAITQSEAGEGVEQGNVREVQS